jgi:hypothetical protein
VGLYKAFANALHTGTAELGYTAGIVGPVAGQGGAGIGIDQDANLFLRGSLGFGTGVGGGGSLTGGFTFSDARNFNQGKGFSLLAGGSFGTSIVTPGPTFSYDHGWGTNGSFGHFGDVTYQSNSYQSGLGVGLEGHFIMSNSWAAGTSLESWCDSIPE